MSVFAASGRARTFDLRADRFATRHYIENIGNTSVVLTTAPFRFTPITGHLQRGTACLRRAITRHGEIA
jgi:hypothetical protein